MRSTTLENVPGMTSTYTSVLERDPAWLGAARQSPPNRPSSPALVLACAAAAALAAPVLVGAGVLGPAMIAPVVRSWPMREAGGPVTFGPNPSFARSKQHNSR